MVRSSVRTIRDEIFWYLFRGPAQSRPDSGDLRDGDDEDARRLNPFLIDPTALRTMLFVAGIAG